MTANINSNSENTSEDSESNLSPEKVAAAKAYQNPYYRYLVLGILTAA